MEGGLASLFESPWFWIWFAENIHRPCGHRTGDNAKEFEMPLVVAFYDIDYAKNVKGINSWESSR